LNRRYEFLEKSPEKWVRRIVVETPAGDFQIDTEIGALERRV